MGASKEHVVDCGKCGATDKIECMSLDSQIFTNCWRCFHPLKLIISEGVGRTEVYYPEKRNASHVRKKVRDL